MSDDHLDDKFCTISPLHHQPYPPKVPPSHSNSMFAAAAAAAAATVVCVCVCVCVCGGGGGGGCKSDSLYNCFFLLGKGDGANVRGDIFFKIY